WGAKVAAPREAGRGRRSIYPRLRGAVKRSGAGGGATACPGLPPARTGGPGATSVCARPGRGGKVGRAGLRPLGVFASSRRAGQAEKGSRPDKPDRRGTTGEGGGSGKAGRRES